MLGIIFSTRNVEHNKTRHIPAYRKTVTRAALNMLTAYTELSDGGNIILETLYPKRSCWLSSMTLFRASNRCYLRLNLPRKGSVSELVRLAGGVQEVPTRMTNCYKLPAAETLFQCRQLQAVSCFRLNVAMKFMQLASAFAVIGKTKLQLPAFLLPSCLTVYVPRLFRLSFFFVTLCGSAQIHEPAP